MGRWGGRHILHNYYSWLGSPNTTVKLQSPHSHTICTMVMGLLIMALLALHTQPGQLHHNAEVLAAVKARGQAMLEKLEGDVGRLQPLVHAILGVCDCVCVTVCV